jgi:hypothetical protein
MYVRLSKPENNKQKRPHRDTETSSAHACEVDVDDMRSINIKNNLKNDTLVLLIYGCLQVKS